MRCGFVICIVLSLAACGDASARPTWPRPRSHDVDGGESLAPRPAARAITAAVEDDRPSARAEKPAPPGISVAPTAAPAAAPGAAAPADADDTINAEEIVIEVEGEAP